MKNLYAPVLLLVAGLGVTSVSHAAEGLVCTSVVRFDLTSPQPTPLTNGTRFNCGPNLLNMTIPEISAAGWIIITSGPVVIAENQGAHQMIIQK